MLRRLPLALTAVCLVVLGAAGCAAHDSTGLVSVTVSRDAGSRPVEVQVVVDATNRVGSHQRVYPGGTADFAGVPLGPVTVRAGDLCPVHTEVADGPAEQVTLSAPPCSH